MANESQFSTAGLESLHWGFRNSAGAFQGFAKLTSANTNTSSGMRRLRFAQSIPATNPQRTTVYSRGDNGYGRGFNFAGQRSPVEVTVGRNDIVAAMAMIGATYYDLGNWRFGVEGVTLPTLSDVMLLSIADAGAEDSGSTGAGFVIRIYPNATLEPLGQADQTFQAEGIFRYNLTVNPFTALPWAAALSSSNFTVADGLSMYTFSPYRMMLHAWVSDGAVTGPTLEYTPISTTYTKGFNADTGAALVVSTVTPATKVVAFSASPSSGVLTNTLYGFSGY